MKIVDKIFQWFLVLALAAGAAFYFRNDLSLAWKNLNQRINPCSVPIAYSIGNFDQRFGLSEDDFKEAIDEAAQIWNQAAGKPLFRYAHNGPLKINLIYDARQDSTIKLQELGIDIDKSKDNYEKLKAQYDEAVKSYDAQKSELDAAIASFNRDKSRYEAKVKAINARGGANPDEAADLEQQRKAINQRAAGLDSEQLSLKKSVDKINSLANVANRLGHDLNLNVISNYNTIGAQSAGEFQEGLYTSDASGEKIDIFQFDNRQMLLTVLAHELGHALGMDHLDNPKAIMYRLNESGSDEMTADDLAELKKVCKLK